MSKVITNKVIDALKKDIPPEISDLNDVSIKRLHYILKHEMKLTNYGIIVKWNTEPKKILISAFDNSGIEYFIRPKDSSFFDNVKQFIGVTNYELRFMKREDYESN